MTSNSPAWTAVRDVEDLLALLCEVQERLQVIRTHAWRQSGNWQQVFVEAEMARRTLRRLDSALTDCWDRLYGQAIHNGLPREEG